MKILHISQPTSEGTAVVVRDLVKLGVGEGHQVTVACPADGPLRKWVCDEGASWVELKTRRSPYPGDAMALMRLRGVFNEYDIVHAHSSKAGALARMAARLSGTRAQEKVVFIPHGWSWLVGGWLAWFYRAFERRMATSCARIVVVSPRELEAGRRVLGATAPLRLIENFADRDRLHLDRPAAPRTSAPLIVCVGRLTRQKGQDRLIRALSQLSTPGVQLRFVGDGKDGSLLKNLAAQLRVADRISFLGACDPAPHYRAADVVAIPSRWEGLSLVLLEAMASGCAIVATEDAAAGALGSAGMQISGYSESDIVCELTDSLDRLLGDESLRIRLGKAARQLAEESFSRSVWAASYRSLWADVLQRSGPPAPPVGRELAAPGM